MIARWIVAQIVLDAFDNFTMSSAARRHVLLTFHNGREETATSSLRPAPRIC